MKNNLRIVITIIFVLIIIMLLVTAGVTLAYKQNLFRDNVVINEEKKTNDVKYESLESLPLDYDFAKMVEDKCYIIMNGNAVYNVKQMEKFIENVKNNVSDVVRIVQYTIEGEPIITDVEYNKEKFIIRNDSRRDHWSAEKDRIIYKKEYDANNYSLVVSDEANKVTNERNDYEISLASKDKDDKIYICSYIKVNKKESDFQILFGKNNKGKHLVLGKGEKFDYDIYSYNGNVEIIVDGKGMSLKNALLNDKITPEQILEKANKDLVDGRIYGAVYRDGGSKVFIYDDYSIIKCNTLDGNKDLYIGCPSMNINEILK